MPTESSPPSESKGAVPYSAAPVIENTSDGDREAAKLRFRKWASSDGSGDKDKVDWAKFRRGFGWYDAADAENFGSYKYFHHDVKDGKVVTVRRFVLTCAGEIQGSRGGVSISDADADAVRSHLAKHYHQWDDKAPWEKGKGAVMASHEVEYKALPFEVKQADDSGTFDGIAAAALNVDSTGDVIAPGAFRQDLGEFLRFGFIGGLNHDWNEPIGRPVEAREEAGGLYLKAAISDTAHGRDCRVLMKDGVVKALSIGYQALGFKMFTDPVEIQSFWDREGYTPSTQDLERAKAGVRLLTRLKLFEVSPVTVPANERAVITGAKKAPVSGSSFEHHADTAVSTVRKFADRVKDRHTARVKEGRSFSTAHRKRIQSAIEAVRSLADEMEAMLRDAEPEPKTLQPSEAAAPQPPVIASSFDDDFARYIDTRAKLLHLGVACLGL